MFRYKRFVRCFGSCIMLKSLLFSYHWKKRYRRGSEWRLSKFNRKLTN